MLPGVAGDAGAARAASSLAVALARSRGGLAASGGAAFLADCLASGDAATRDGAAERLGPELLRSEPGAVAALGHALGEDVGARVLACRAAAVAYKTFDGRALLDDAALAAALDAADDDVRVGALGVFEHRAVCGERFDALADRLASSFRDESLRPAVVAAARRLARRRDAAPRWRPAAAALADRAVGALGDRAAEHAAVAARSPRVQNARIASRSVARRSSRSSRARRRSSTRTRRRWRTRS